MRNKNSEKEWLHDFNEFVETKNSTVPKEISDKILTFVHKELNPSAWTIFSKLLGIHLIVGTLSMAICDQFGMSPFNSGFSLSEYFMKFNATFCMTFCGFFFVGSSVVFARVLFRLEEFAVLRKNSLVQVFSLSVLSLVVFITLGANIAAWIGLSWMLGALLGGLLPLLLIRHGKSVG